MDVHTIDPQMGGELPYALIALGAKQVRFMKESGSPMPAWVRVRCEVTLGSLDVLG